jgi:hypothetical protein
MEYGKRYFYYLRHSKETGYLSAPGYSNSDCSSMKFKDQPNDPRLTNDWAIDSLKVRLPLSKVKVLNDSLSEMILYVSQSTGDILDEKERKKIGVGEKSKGIKITFSREIQAGQYVAQAGERKGSIEYFIMLINAKALEDEYFTGITETTIIKLYEYLMKSEAVYFPLQLLDEFECTDIDFKKDYFQDPSEQQKALQNMHGRAISSKAHGQGVKSLFVNKIQGTNYYTGIQFNERKTATQKAPFFKIYSKTNNLQDTGKNGSNIFAMACLKDEFTALEKLEGKEGYPAIPQNLYRNEFTIKDKKHLAKFGIGNTFKDLLELTQEQIEAMYTSIQKLCLEGNYTTNLDIQKKNLSPSDLLVLSLLLIPLKRSDTYTPIKREVLKLFNKSSKQNKYNKSKLLDRVFYKHIAVTGKGKKWRELDDALNKTGGNFLSNEH